MPLGKHLMIEDLINQLKYIFALTAIASLQVNANAIGAEIDPEMIKPRQLYERHKITIDREILKLDSDADYFSDTSPWLDKDIKKKTGAYVSAGAGIGRIQNIAIDENIGGGSLEFDTGFSGDIGLGYDFGTIRAEVNYNQLSSDLAAIQNIEVNNVGVQVQSWFVSAAYDFRADRKWQPYISAGIGNSELNVETDTTIGNVTVTAGVNNITSFLGKLGINYETSEAVDLSENYGFKHMMTLILV